MIETASSADPRVRALLRSHPWVEAVSESANPGLDFTLNGWGRALFLGGSPGAVGGIVELIDNNPLVCADTVVLPHAGVSLALMALGPLVGAGLLVEPPTVLANVPTSETELSAFLQPLGWPDGAIVSCEELPLDGVYGVTAIAAIQTPDDLEDIDALFEERYGRSFFIRRQDDGNWDTSLVKGQHFAAYRLRINVDQPSSLLTVRVMADAHGKAGASQIVHAMNVMCGFPESLSLI